MQNLHHMMLTVHGLLRSQHIDGHVVPMFLTGNFPPRTSKIGRNEAINFSFILLSNTHLVSNSINEW